MCVCVLNEHKAIGHQFCVGISLLMYPPLWTAGTEIWLGIPDLGGKLWAMLTKKGVYCHIKRPSRGKYTEPGFLDTTQDGGPAVVS